MSKKSDVDCCMSPCEAVAAISALALAISKGKSAEEVGLLATYLVQLGDTLATISVVLDTCCTDDDSDAAVVQAASMDTGNDETEAEEIKEPEEE